MDARDWLVSSHHLFFKRPLAAYSNHLMNDDIVTAFCILLHCKWSFGVFILWIDGNVPTHFRDSTAHICAFWMAFRSSLLVRLFRWSIFRLFCWLNSSIRHLKRAQILSVFLSRNIISISMDMDDAFICYSILLTFCLLLPSLILNCNWAFNYFTHTAFAARSDNLLLFIQLFC